MTVEMVEALVKLVLVILASILMPQVFAFIKAKVEDMKDEKLRTIISTLVYAAEQLLKKEDPTGEKRKAYVLEQLRILGIKVTGYVDAMIEEEVITIYVPQKNRD